MMIFTRDLFISFARRNLALLLTGFVTFGLAQDSLSHAFWKKGTDQAVSLPQRNFLPPVATINPIIEPDALELEEEGIDEVVMMPAVTPSVLKASPKITQLDTDLGIRESSKDYQTLRTVQDDLDNADLDNLWKSTVERNPVIQFSLEKVHAPVELHQKQSSLFMRKTLNTLITGITMATTMIPGGGSYRNIGAMAVGDATRNLTLGPQVMPDTLLSATEKIQLAGLIDELQASLIETYHNYKRTLATLANAHQNTVQNNVRYSMALGSQNQIAILASGTAYYKALMDETRLRQEAKLQRIKLERLAGADSVSNLKLTVAFSPEFQKRMAEGASSQPIATKPARLAPAPPEPRLNDALPNNTNTGKHLKKESPEENL